MMRSGGVVLLGLLVFPPAISAQPEEQTIDPDRPDVTNTVNTVPPKRIQFEIGGASTRTGSDRSWGFPVTVRAGMTDRFELRAEADGFLWQRTGGIGTTGFGNIALGTKLRVRPEGAGGLPLSIQAAIDLPTASKGFGSGDPDYVLTALSRVDVGRLWQVGVNYGIGAIGAGGGRAHFAQHLVSASAGFQTGNWNPFFEGYWISREDPDGTAITAIDVGTLYIVKPRMALDGGFQIGVSRAAPDFAFFAGVSFMVGTRAPTSTFRRVRDPD